MNKKFGIVLVIVSILFTLGLTACGVAGFGVTVSPSDVKGIDLSELLGSDYIIKVEAYVETGDMGIDLSPFYITIRFKTIVAPRI